MPNSSTAHDILRFVRLRPPGPVGTSQFTLSQGTNLAGELSLLARSARRQRAETWQRDTARFFLDAARNNALFQQLRDAVREMVSQPEPSTVRDLLLHLHERELCISSDPEPRRLLRDEISDVLLATYFAPSAAPEDLPILQSVFIVLELLRAARELGLTLEDLRERERPNQLLDQPLRQTLDARVAISGSIGSDYSRKFSVGIGDLLVVKQHIRAYEASEIAHIENIMPRERRERSHRRLDRSEETFTTELETEVEKETELATTERFELSEEASRTVKEEQQLSFGLSLSAKYGPTVEFGSEFEYSRQDSREETGKSSTTYAKDVVERSLERVRDRVLRRRTTLVLQELEETNLHAFEPGFQREVGIYQFVEKVYEARVFDYGKREMFDFMIPEPASYLWHLSKEQAGEAAEQNEPVPPLELPPSVIPELTVVGADGVSTYERLAVRYRADGIEPPPEEKITLSKSARYPDGGGAEGRATNTLILDLNVPPGYRPQRARLSAIAHSGESDSHQLTLVGFVVLDRLSIRDIEDGQALPAFAQAYGTTYLNPSTVSGISRSDEVMLFGMSESQTIELDSGAFPDESPLQIGVFGYATKEYVVSVDVECTRTDGLLQAWRLKTFDKLCGAYEERLLEFQEQYARFQQEQRKKVTEGNTDRQFGAAPSRKEEIIHGELKKHCIAIVTEDFFAANDSPQVMEEPSGGAPQFRFAVARERGNLVRFLEQVFEWQHLQYVFYPYFWGRTGPWAERFHEDDAAHRFRQFKQSGWARVVVPVRRGFEEALHYYLETGNVWGGHGAPPRIGEALSLSIADEIRERTDDGVLDAIPVGPAWEVRVPTNLVLLRADASLPTWRNATEDGWNWTPTDAP